MSSRYLTAATNIRRFREDLGLSTGALAEICRMRPEFISAIEHGRIQPKTLTYERLAQALNVSLEDLFLEEAPAEELPDMAVWGIRAVMFMITAICLVVLYAGAAIIAIWLNY